MAMTIPTAYPEARRSGRAALRLVGVDSTGAPLIDEPHSPNGVRTPVLTVVPDPHSVRSAPPRRRVSPGVRRRRTMLAVVGLCVLGLALPLGGTGGHSHATGSALAGNPGGAEYTVQPGDSLWSIAARVDPSGDPRPLAAKLAAELGSSSVQPGEHITIP
jgi:hypothetical protein